MFSHEAEQALKHYDWFGNIRELDNVIQRALILAPGDEIAAEHLYLPAVSANIAADVMLDDAVEAKPVAANIKDMEKNMILDALKSTNGVRKAAAERCLNTAADWLNAHLEDNRKLRYHGRTVSSESLWQLYILRASNEKAKDHYSKRIQDHPEDSI